MLHPVAQREILTGKGESMNYQSHEKSGIFPSLSNICSFFTTVKCKVKLAIFAWHNAPPLKNSLVAAFAVVCVACTAMLLHKTKHSNYVFNSFALKIAVVCVPLQK